MRNKLGKLILVLATLVLLLMFAFGPAAPGVAWRMGEPPAGAVEMWDGLNGLLADPAVGGGSSAT
jgi:hypothetical protein